MLAIIWLEIVTKVYDELCHKISQSSLLLKTDSVDIIFQHRLRSRFSVILIIGTKFTVVYLYWPIIRELQLIWQKC